MSVELLWEVVLLAFGAVAMISGMLAGRRMDRDSVLSIFYRRSDVRSENVILYVFQLSVVVFIVFSALGMIAFRL